MSISIFLLRSAGDSPPPTISSVLSFLADAEVSLAVILVFRPQSHPMGDIYGFLRRNAVSKKISSGALRRSGNLVDCAHQRRGDAELKTIFDNSNGGPCRCRKASARKSDRGATRWIPKGVHGDKSPIRKEKAGMSASVVARRPQATCGSVKPRLQTSGGIIVGTSRWAS